MSVSCKEEERGGRRNGSEESSLHLRVGERSRPGPPLRKHKIEERKLASGFDVRQRFLHLPHYEEKN